MGVTKTNGSGVARHRSFPGGITCLFLAVYLGIFEHSHHPSRVCFGWNFPIFDVPSIFSSFLSSHLLGGGLKNILYFHPEPGGNDPI